MNLPRTDKYILIIDEEGFSRICSALLSYEGYMTRSLRDINDTSIGLNKKEVGLIITSYPYSASFLDKIKSKHIPTIVLSDQIDRELINILDGYNNFYCMIKPLDYQKFRTLVKQVLTGQVNLKGGYNIV